MGVGGVCSDVRVGPIADTRDRRFTAHDDWRTHTGAAIDAGSSEPVGRGDIYVRIGCDLFRQKAQLQAPDAVCEYIVERAQAIASHNGRQAKRPAGSAVRLPSSVRPFQ